MKQSKASRALLPAATRLMVKENNTPQVQNPQYWKIRLQQRDQQHHKHHHQQRQEVPQRRRNQLNIDVYTKLDCIICIRGINIFITYPNFMQTWCGINYTIYFIT